MVRLRWGSVSITGNFRDNNEDRCQEDPQGRFFLVCDGMGGQAAGEKASELAADLVSKQFEQDINFSEDSRDHVISVIDQAVSNANMEIMALGEVEPDYHNMGTTIVFLVCVGDTFFVGGVGDSRVYRLRNDVFEQLTIDHSLTQALVDAGTISEEDAVDHRYRNVLYRYLGSKEGGAGTEANSIAPESGERFLLCTDGVNGGVEDDQLAELLKLNDDPQATAEQIVKAAQDGGSKDNITCTVVHVE